MKAARGYAHPEAVAAFEEAIVHAERLPAAERDWRVVELILRLAPSLCFLGRFSEALDQRANTVAPSTQQEGPYLRVRRDIFGGETLTVFVDILAFG